MKTSNCLYSIVAFCTLACSLLQAAPPAGNFTLTFEDNFDGSTLDGSKWKVGGHFNGIAGQGANDPGNVSVSSGSLKITAKNASTVYSGNTYNYGCGEISTYMNHAQQYGYYEARMKFDVQTGMWPAFWLMPDRGTYGNPYAYNRSFLKFDLTSAGIGTVNTATLRLTIAAIGTNSSLNRNVLVFKVADDTWSEGLLTGIINRYGILCLSNKSLIPLVALTAQLILMSKAMSVLKMAEIKKFHLAWETPL